MFGNEGYEPMSNNRKQRNQRPPAGEQGERPKQEKRGKQWQRSNNKRDQWQDAEF